MSSLGLIKGWIFTTLAYVLNNESAEVVRELTQIKTLII